MGLKELIYFAVVGLAAGFLAGLIVKGRGFGFLLNLLVGIGGALLGAWLFSALNIRVHIVNNFISQLIVAFAGAVVLLFIIGIFRRR